MSDAAGAQLGLRERGKREKRQRIGEAARAIFRLRGYDGATMREIANRAGVALGTLFVYAHDKRDLFMMCVNGDLDELTTHSAPAGAPLLDHVIAIYRARYDFWASQPALARAAMREFNAPYVDDDDAGVELRRGDERRGNVVKKLADLVREHRIARKLTLHADDETCAWLLHDIYLTEVRLWLNDRAPDAAKGLERLRRLLQIALRGTGLDEAS